ncbi:hypothetical protein E2C01_089274 [Portunus trituberculatus]|uniref:Uncharacterized protein n=1 Tax=Portunus trituberculatus TaxID=210409 RepID=A0A5B7JD35_PORTR|nr:hypothetical protein [Portunus trituberculatus]
MGNEISRAARRWPTCADVTSDPSGLYTKAEACLAVKHRLTSKPVFTKLMTAASRCLFQGFTWHGKGTCMETCEA